MLRGFRLRHPHWTLTFVISCKMMRFMFEEYGEIIAFENAHLFRFEEKVGGKKTPDCIMPLASVDAVHKTYFTNYGTLERFYEQGMRFIANAKKQGVTNWEVDFLENMLHDAVMLPTNVRPATKEGIHHDCAFTAGVLFKEPEPVAAN
ncbi:hypothetical protein BBO99_00001506 [Phytophthora kernoviae]|uniref:Uncharacterized protein n=1 Tax=Phytophthora kernoviae TaxID=325452 RepID=A0A3R7JUS6_9STRA|nr:hypothetical protein BBI17_001329 [Phytophthora kernoviae]RLN84186.1 hypothetical protein BBO99_00001506 [Phytophthora kernoviae]